MGLLWSNLRDAHFETVYGQFFGNFVLDTEMERKMVLFEMVLRH